MNEKITDKATSMFEKATGYVVNRCSPLLWTSSDNSTLQAVSLALGRTSWAAIANISGLCSKDVPDKFSN